MRVALLSFVVMGGGLACAPKWVGPTPSGYFFHARAADICIPGYRTTEVIVQVQDAGGHRVDEVPVTFYVAPDWAESTSVSPLQTITEAGTASTVFTTGDRRGSAGVIACVDETQQVVRINVHCRRKVIGSGPRIQPDPTGAVQLSCGPKA